MSVNVKQPGEKLHLAVDFTKGLATGDTVTSTYDIDVYDPLGADKTSTILSNGTKQLSGNVLSGLFVGGTNGYRYKIHFSMTTNNGELLEEDIYLLICEGLAIQLMPDVKLALAPEMATGDFDALLYGLIEGVISDAEDEIGAKIQPVTDEIVYLDGGKNTLYLPHLNISNVSVWQDSNKEFEDEGLLDPDYYTVYLERGKIKRNSASKFLSGNQVIKVKYDGGYSILTIPPNLKQRGLVKQIAYEFRRRKDIGLSSVTYPDGSISKFSITEWLPDVLSVLGKFKRIFL
jgi:hypothetical protein